MRAESIASVTFPFTTTIYQQYNSDEYIKRSVLNNSRLAVGLTTKDLYIIWDSVEWDE